MKTQKVITRTVNGGTEKLDFIIDELIKMGIELKDIYWKNDNLMVKLE